MKEVKESRSVSDRRKSTFEIQKGKTACVSWGPQINSFRKLNWNLSGVNSLSGAKHVDVGPKPPILGGWDLV